MRSSISISAIAPLLPYLTGLAAAQASGSGSTTRYWDCCKPSCAWPDNVGGGVSGAVGVCSIDDTPLGDGATATSGCEPGGSAFMCSSHSPWEVSDDLAYGWAAVRIAGGSEAEWCCACYELEFTSGPVAGKRMIVQATNTGADLGDNHFDIAVGDSSCFAALFTFVLLLLFLVPLALAPCSTGLSLLLLPVLWFTRCYSSSASGSSPMPAPFPLPQWSVGYLEREPGLLSFSAPRGGTTSISFGNFQRGLFGRRCGAPSPTAASTSTLTSRTKKATPLAAPRSLCRPSALKEWIAPGTLAHL